MQRKLLQTKYCLTQLYFYVCKKQKKKSLFQQLRYTCILILASNTFKYKYCSNYFTNSLEIKSTLAIRQSFHCHFYSVLCILGLHPGRLCQKHSLTAQIHTTHHKQSKHSHNNQINLQYKTLHKQNFMKKKTVLLISTIY